MGEYLERFLSSRPPHADRDGRFMHMGYVVWLVGISLAALVELIFLAVIVWDVIR